MLRSDSMQPARRIIDVHTGEVKISTGNSILRSTGVGSCVVVVAMNREEQVGGMAHIMLPGSAPKDAEKKTNYAFDGISQLLREMLAAGIGAGHVEVCLVGAGNVLKRHDDTICDANIESVTSILKEHGIPIKATVLGGVQRKTAFLDIEKGIISYTKGDEEDVLWQAERKETAAI